MKSRYFFRWTCLVATSVTLALFLASLPNRATAHAAGNNKPGAITEGSLRVLDDAGQPTGDCPLKHTSVKAEISGFLSRVSVTQEFENPFKEKIEAVYVFPLPQNAAVDDMTMIVGNRTVRGQIMKREEAQAAYTAAKNKGQVASLLDQERPNIFTQSVANIMPGERVTVTIKYVETLKYEDGSYEFVFPMVVGERFIPGGTDNVKQADSASDAARVPEAARISPPVMPAGMRAGHDISIEVALDAGVPVESLNCASHEIEMERQDWSHAVIRLKNQTAIPNKDFVFKYDVAGRKVEDAVLAHRSAKGGFFTMILQPPERVTSEDVMPKELVFVVDTSGSMDGFPLDKARETAKLALNNLYPQDTFNLITFSGDEHLLFPEPVPATPENLRKAKKFLDGSRSGGGTEMMKAIRAALDTTDEQGHIRIVCFMTDGYVGNDMDIIAEIQKHPNARVFAMGFSGSPNRFLLDKMAESGLGEVDYVTETDADVKTVAQRFHERVRNPLLTELSIDWSGLAVEDVYPQRIPDLFSAKPVILSGRYLSGGKGVIRLKGKMSGREFVREIAVELPEQQTQHDVLATLWARTRIDDLMGQDYEGMQRGRMRDDLRQEITQLGLEYRLMTQFTSFVAVDETSMTDGNDPRRVDVAVESSTTDATDAVASQDPRNISPAQTPSSAAAPAQAASYATSNSRGVSEYVTVEAASSATLDVSANTTGTTLTEFSIFNLPLNGRSFKSTVLLPSGTVSTGGNQLGQPMQDQVSVNGQRPTSNAYFIDGVSANFGIAPGQSPGLTVAGTVPGLTASGGTNNLVSADAIQEIKLTTRNFSAEYGRSSGGQFTVVTRSGTNEFNGSLYEFFGNDALDANDWFASSRSLRQSPRRLNNFGGTLGGPIRRDKTFFFAAYEGLRLRQPLVGLTDVPSIAARRLAPVNLQTFLDAYPLPNGEARADGFAEFAASYANPARHDAMSFHVDHSVTSQFQLVGRYNFTTSRAEERGAGLFSLNTLNQVRSTTQTLTLGATYTISPSVIADLRGNYSRLNARSVFRLDDFGGANAAVALFPGFVTNGNAFSSFNLNGRNAALATGGDVDNVQRQFNLVGTVTKMAGNHTLKFGADYRRLAPIIGFEAFEQSVLFNRVNGALDGTASRVNLFARDTSQRPVFNNLSVYGQDEWRITKRLSLSYGVRWEINPPPSATDGQEPFAITSAADVSALRLATRGTRLWKTNYLNIAPRFGLAYQLSQRSGREMIVRGSFNVLYDLGSEETGLAFSDSFPLLAAQTFFDLPYPSALTVASPATLNPHLPTNAPFVAFAPHLKLPYTLQWAVDIERALGSQQTVSASYVGTTGRRLLLAQTFLNPSPDFPLVRLTTNGATSDYHALQLQFNRRFVNGLQAIVSYTWAKSIDDASQDSLAATLLRSSDARDERGVADFDVRHLLSGAVTYALPPPRLDGWSRALTRNWAIDAIFNARSARPVNVVYGVPTAYGFAYLRPDFRAGVPVYLEAAVAAGGRRLNPAAFSIPAVERQGTLGRNSLRGFPLYQIDFALHRQFDLTERCKLQLKIAAFNLFNHPNFEDPVGTDTSLGSRLSAAGVFLPNTSFGEAASMLGRSLWGGSGRGFSSFYQVGGPRTLQLSLRFQF